MRHIGTVIGAAVVSPLAWLLLAIGQDRSAREFTNAQDSGLAVDTDLLLLPVLTLAAAGIVLGLIATLRFSPLGAALTGVAYVATDVGALVNPTLLNVIDHKLSLNGHPVDLAAPVRSGTALVLGALLLVGVASVHRWRRWPRPAGEGAESPPELVEPTGPDQDRPLGADGLGLTGPGRHAAAEPQVIDARWTPAPQAPGTPDRTDDVPRTDTPGWTDDAPRTGTPEWTDTSEWRILQRRTVGDPVGQPRG
ncbi:hypothetical protein [Plantactinospora sp. B5E13]|uniref:hypothetical protein n=1 Tax=Plantactinospora sp. B5E13 TaxID=3153758 RepID=UPI00325F0D04